MRQIGRRAAIIDYAHEKRDGAGEGENGPPRLDESAEDDGCWFDRPEHAGATGVDAGEGGCGRQKALQKGREHGQNEVRMSRGTRSPVATGVRIALATLGLLLALWLLVQLRSICVLVLIALVLATGIHPVVECLQARQWPPGGWSLPRWLAVGGVLLAIVAVVLALFYFLGNVIWTEGSQAWNDLPSYVDAVTGWLEKARRHFPQLPSNQDLALSLQDQLGRAAHYFWQTTAAVLGLLGMLGSTLTVLVMTFYMLLEREMLRRAFLSLVPPESQELIDETTAEALVTMGGWLRGQTILVAAMTTLVTLAMLALGLPHPLLLGLVAGVGELIPMVGPILGGVVAVPLAFFLMPLWVGFVTLGFFVLLSIVEGNLIVPKVMEKNVDLPPFFTVVAVLAGGTLGGVVGALLALPLAAALRVYLRRLVVPAIQGKV